MKHTPGPWEVIGQSEGGRYITVKATMGRTVARVPWCTDAQGEAGTATDHHDAVLIAAAPELLEACTIVADTIDGMHDLSRTMDSLRRHCKQAIAKATGGER